MKKLLILALASLPLLITGCSTTVNYTPKAGGTSEYVEPEKEKDVTYEFYLSYSHTHLDTKGIEPALLVVPWYSLTALGTIPEQLNTTEKVLAIAASKGYTTDPAFPVFKGFSKYGCCLRDADLWNFETDYEQKAVVALYGIWVAE